MMKQKMKSLVQLSMVCAALMLGACSDDHDHDEEAHGSVNEEGCEHMAGGPSKAVTAALELTGTIPDATAEHTRIDVTLVDGFEGKKGGYVRYEAAETGDFAFFVDSDVAVALLDDQGQPVAFEGAGAAVTECSEVALRYTAELTAGSSYRLKIGPTDAATARLVIEHDAGEEGHNH